MPPMRYSIEISIVPDFNSVPIAEIKAGARLVFEGEIQVVESSSPSPLYENKSSFFEARYMLAGFLLRASRVCNDQFEPLANGSFGNFRPEGTCP